MALRAYGAAVLMGAAALWIVSGTAREQAVLGAGAMDPVRALEASVAAHPNDPEATRTLAQEYLDARQPGLAIVLVEGAPAPVREDVRIEHVYARALIDEGHNDEALDVENRVIGSCRAVADGSAGPVGCNPVLLASAMRRTDILRELLALGVEDARAHPEASLVAYQNATREARVALE
jgi:hypothetical protein